MSCEPDDDADAEARAAEIDLVAGLVSAVRSRGGSHLDQDEIDAALGVTHDEEQTGLDAD
ncbi:MAG: hypothetical protein V9G19_24545 [Tetrasphaera sp.]